MPGEFEAGGESALQEEAHTGAEQILTFHGGMLWNVEEEHDMQLSVFDVMFHVIIIYL